MADQATGTGRSPGEIAPIRPQALVPTTDASVMIPLLYLALVPPLWAISPAGSGSTGGSGSPGQPGSTTGSGDTGTTTTTGTGTGTGTSTSTSTSTDTGATGTTADPIDTGATGTASLPGGSGASPRGPSAAELAGEVGGCHCDLGGSPLSSSWLVLLWMLRRKLR